MRAWRWAVLAAYAALLLATAPAWPDGWDGVGFVESVRDFDLGRFRPHPPGYPVYVALLRLAAPLAGTPMRACVLVAVTSGLVAALLAWDAARRCAGERAAWAVATLVATAPSVWRACNGVGSEGPALACAAACVWGLVAAGRGARSTSAAIVLGLGAGLGLGVRLSWAPLYVAALALVSGADRKRAWTTATVASATWAFPFVAWIGPAKLGGLFAEHFGGHAAHWGGTAWTEPGPVRALWLARDILVDGFGLESGALGLVTTAVFAIAAGQALRAWRAAGWLGWRVCLGLAVPYLIWIGLGQNLRDQPRHALPLVALLAAGLALPAAGSRRAFAVVGALAWMVSLRTALDAYERRTIPPPGQQLVDLAREQPSPDCLTVFGVASVRFFEMTELASRALAVGSLGEARMELTRANELPARVWVTGEVAGIGDSRWPLQPFARLCRPVRLERARPCLDVYEWALGAGR